MKSLFRNAPKALHHLWYHLARVTHAFESEMVFWRVAYYGVAQAWRGVAQAWRGVAQAWRGVAWRGVAWRGVAQAWRGVAWRGVAWRGVAGLTYLGHGIFLISLSSHIVTMPLEAGELILKLRNGAAGGATTGGGRGRCRRRST